MRYIKYFVPLLVASTLFSCTNDDTDLEWLINNNPKPPARDIALDYSPLSEGDDVIVTDINDESFNDYWENSAWTTTVRVNYTHDGATVDGTGSRATAEVVGGHVVINVTASRVHIIANGECKDGSLKIYSSNKYKLTLEGLNLTNPNGAAINNQCGKTLYLVLAPGSENRLEDGAHYAEVEGEDMKATLFSEGQLAVSGKGSLKVYSHGKHGIVTDDYLRVRKGNSLYVNSTSGNGIRGKDGVYIDGSVINVETSGGAAKGISSDAHVSINGGRTTLITSGAPVIDAALSDTSSCAGIKADSIIVITGGVVNIKSTGEGGKGINAHMNLEITGGELNIVTTGRKGIASPKGIKCDSEMIVTGGSIYSYSAHAAPIDAMPLTLSPGYTTYTTTLRAVTIKY